MREELRPIMPEEKGQKGKAPEESEKQAIARRTAFLARFIVLREHKRSRAHRAIELLCWRHNATTEEVVERIRNAFKINGDKLTPVDRDIRRSLMHAERSYKYFIDEYIARATDTFVEALHDYERSNALLFLDVVAPKSCGWRLSTEILKERIDKR